MDGYLNGSPLDNKEYFITANTRHANVVFENKCLFPSKL